MRFLKGPFQLLQLLTRKGRPDPSLLPLGVMTGQVMSSLALALMVAQVMLARLRYDTGSVLRGQARMWMLLETVDRKLTLVRRGCRVVHFIRVKAYERRKKL